ncbi:MAG: L-dopachrome tautomerase-related protein [Pseudomonadota bacterium]
MKKLLLLLLACAAFIAVVLNARYGEGEPYRDVSTPPAAHESALEMVLQYPEPIGGLAVTRQERLFFTVHPESRPSGNKLLEWIDGAAEPYPSGSAQPELFDTVLGLTIDRQNRLWSLDHGNHGFGTPRLLAFDLETDSVVVDVSLAADVAPKGSLLMDLTVSADGRYVVIADASIWRKDAALIVYDVEAQTQRRVLSSHPSVSAQHYVIRAPSRTMSFFGGILSLKAGVSGIALDATNDWLYYAATNHDGLFRVPFATLLDTSLPPRQAANAIERYSDKPLSDGVTADPQGRLYVTNVEHGGIMWIDAERELKTLVSSPNLRWPDALAIGPEGWLYVTDSAIPDLVLRATEHIAREGPYAVYRIQPGGQ